MPCWLLCQLQKVVYIYVINRLSMFIQRGIFVTSCKSKVFLFSTSMSLLHLLKMMFLLLSFPSIFLWQFLQCLRILGIVYRSRSDDLKIGWTCYKEVKLWTGIKYLWVQNKFFVGGELNINIGTSISIEFLLVALKHRNKLFFIGTLESKLYFNCIFF
jgi:hypothetical protein